jgi:V/A-type H+-transporting ATPase subunit E
MAEELQHLIERIQREAVDTGEQKAAELLAQAREKASTLVREAEQKAAALVQKAEQDAQLYTQRSQQTLQQASRDLLISVGQGVETIFSRLVVDAVGQALTAETMRDMLVNMTEAYGASGGRTVEVLVSPQDQDKLLAQMRERFRDQLQKGLTVRGDERVFKGFQVALEGGRVKHQFTPEAIAESLSNFLRPKLAEIVYQAARQGGGPKA